ncbi:MAG: HAMP domain-containing histidine kinase [Defluviitaleaceae bacterium]|nr:HAMP domain-containing histidine kinase [Defluviitaleaceae bacterium]
MFNRLRRNLRGSILTAFSLLLLLSFALVFFIFNVAVRQYIRHHAVTELAETQELYDYFGGFTMIVRSGLFGQRINHFYFSDNFELVYGYAAPTTDTIAEALRDNNLPPSLISNRRLPTDGGIFYITTQPVSVFGEGWHAVFYVDITDISRFSNQVNMLLLLVVMVIWALAMIIATFLSSSLAHPLFVLNNFARQIGRGDFTQNYEAFANEEFETLNQSLNHTAKQLAKYDNEQKTFFQNVSHELRTPLMSIKSYAEGIKYGIMDTQKASDTILEATNRLTSMVGDILYVSRIDNITIPFEDTVDLRKVITERIRIHETPTSNIRITFRNNAEPVVVPCIKAYIERALDNLISNALRYASTEINIDCYNHGKKAVIEIKDDGPGFEPNELPHVFERFYRGKSGLTGIGLAIVKSIVEQHNGTAFAENDIINGAVLTITIPRAR